MNDFESLGEIAANWLGVIPKTGIEAFIIGVMLVLTIVDWVRIRSAVPKYRETVVSIGILGTFIGVILALEQARPDPGGGMAALTESTGRLVDAMHTAFVTSIAGLFLASGTHIGSAVFYRRPEEDAEEPEDTALEPLERMGGELARLVALAETAEEQRRAARESDQLGTLIKLTEKAEKDRRGIHLQATRARKNHTTVICGEIAKGVDAAAVQTEAGEGLRGRGREDGGGGGDPRRSGIDVGPDCADAQRGGATFRTARQPDRHHQKRVGGFAVGG